MPNQIKLSPGGVVPRDMNARQWDTFTAQARADYIRNGQTGYDTGTGYFLGDDNGTPKFSIGNSSGNKVTWNGSTLSITGTVTATTGTIGGWTLSTTYLEAGTGSSTVRLDSGGVNPAISAGSATPASAPFRVTQAGALTATNATITGAITSTSGAIGGWTLGATALTAGSGATTVGLDSGGTNPALYAGSATPASAPFRVTQGGALTATSATITGTVTSTAGTIGGWTLAATSLTAGSGANTVGIDSGGTNPAFYAGSATPGSAPFRVTQAGALTATSATITGNVNLTNSAQTFTPTGWAGFSSDPSGDISYLDFGAFVMMWRDTALTGNSDEAFMAFTGGVPAGIRPSAGRYVRCQVIDENYLLGGVAFIDNSGGMSFFLETVETTYTPDVIAFTNSFTDPSSAGSKGLPAGWLIMYPK